MNKLQHIVGAIGVFTCLFILASPPLRSPSGQYAELKAVNGSFVPVHISRFVVRNDTAATENDGILRTEIDAGELLRELALVAVLAIGLCLWLPRFITAMQRELVTTAVKPPKA